MKSKAAKRMQDALFQYWDDQASLLGCRERSQFTITWGKGDLTGSEFASQLQKILNAISRTCQGNGADRYPIKVVTGRTRTGVNRQGAATEWHVNITDSWSNVLYLYTWAWVTAQDGSHRSGRWEMDWMRMYKKASTAFFLRGMYLPPTAPEPKPPASKDEVRQRKIEALETRRANWEIKAERARKWIIKIDRSLRALRRHVKEK